MRLGDFLLAECGSRAPWNCSTFPADWAILCGHPDFAAAWRDVTDPDECEAVQAEAGALVALWDEGIGDGMEPVDDPEAGDVAVVRVGPYEAGAIFTGERWAIKGQRCVHFRSVDEVQAVKVWRP